VGEWRGWRNERVEAKYFVVENPEVEDGPWNTAPPWCKASTVSCLLLPPSGSAPPTGTLPDTAPRILQKTAPSSALEHSPCVNSRHCTHDASFFHILRSQFPPYKQLLLQLFIVIFCSTYSPFSAVLYCIYGCFPRSSSTFFTVSMAVLQLFSVLFYCIYGCFYTSFLSLFTPSTAAFTVLFCRFLLHLRLLLQLFSVVVYSIYGCFYSYLWPLIAPFAAAFIAIRNYWNLLLYLLFWQFTFLDSSFCSYFYGNSQSLKPPFMATFLIIYVRW
jgi:hypothetical protein